MTFIVLYARTTTEWAHAKNHAGVHNEWAPPPLLDKSCAHEWNLRQYTRNYGQKVFVRHKAVYYFLQLYVHFFINILL